MTTLLEVEVTTHEGVRYLLYFTELFGRHFLEVTKVKTQTLCRHQRALLLDMRTQHLTQRVVDDMGSRVVAGDRLTTLSVHLCDERSRRITRQFCHNMYRQIILAFAI